MKTESLFALFTGAAIGATLGVLFAPDSGEETRRKLKKEAVKNYEETKHRAKVARRFVHTKKRHLKKDLDELKTTLSEYGNDLKEDAKHIIFSKIENLEAALAENLHENIETPIVGNLSDEE